MTNLHNTIKDILKDINCYLPDDKLEAWTSVLMKAYREELQKIIDKNTSEEFKTTDYDKVAEDVIETVASL